MIDFKESGGVESGGYGEYICRDAVLADIILTWRENANP